MKTESGKPPRYDEISIYQKEDEERGVTTPLLRHLIATAVRQTTREIYEANAPGKCLQSSAGVKHLLSRVGIRARMVAGAVCYLKIDANTEQPVGRSGFWGRDHHIWTVTQHNEVVDISICMLNEHKKNRGNELAPPALWWPISLGSPHFFRYLWDVNCETQEFEGKEADLFSSYMEALDKCFDALCASLSPYEFEFPDLLGGEGELRRQLDNKHPYLTAAMQETLQSSPLPNWISQRQSEMEDAAKRGVSAKSRLMEVDGLFKIIRS